MLKVSPVLRVHSTKHEVSSGSQTAVGQIHSPAVLTLTVTLHTHKHYFIPCTTVVMHKLLNNFIFTVSFYILSPVQQQKTRLHFYLYFRHLHGFLLCIKPNLDSDEQVYCIYSKTNLRLKYTHSESTVICHGLCLSILPVTKPD